MWGKLLYFSVYFGQNLWYKKCNWLTRLVRSCRTVWWCHTVNSQGRPGRAGRARCGAGWWSSLSSTPALLQTTHRTTPLHHYTTPHHTTHQTTPHYLYQPPRATEMLSADSVSLSQLSRWSSAVHEVPPTSHLWTSPLSVSPQSTWLASSPHPSVQPRPPLPPLHSNRLCRDHFYKLSQSHHHHLTSYQITQIWSKAHSNKFFHWNNWRCIESLLKARIKLNDFINVNS